MSVPVIAGLAVGIAVVVLFALLFGGANSIAQRKFPIDISIDGLNDRYSVAESIDFTIRATGYGIMCGYPNVKIIDLDRGGEIILSLPEGVILVLCDPDANNNSDDRTWTLAELGATSPVTINKVGHYKIIADFDSKATEKYFIVDNTVKQVIDATKDLEEVKAFLAYYPNASSTVYFVTTCADESCETLVRVPSIIEYSYEERVDDDSKIALLRVSMEQEWEGKPVFFQVSCQIVGSEDGRDIHGSQIEREIIAEFLQNENRCP